MAMKREMGPEQPDLRPRNLRDLEFPSETVPEEVRELWASLPRRERQRSRRRYFRDQGACCSRAVFSSLLSTIDIRVQNIESALAEYLHATAASIPVPLQEKCSRGCRPAIVACTREHRQRDSLWQSSSCRARQDR